MKHSLMIFIGTILYKPTYIYQTLELDFQTDSCRFLCGFYI